MRKVGHRGHDATTRANAKLARSAPEKSRRSRKSMAGDAPRRRGVDGASFLSRQVVAWATGIILDGRRRPLQKEDLPSTPSMLFSEGHDDICARGAQLWSEQIAKTNGTKREPSLAAVWYQLSKANWLIGCSLAFVCGICTTVARLSLIHI